MTVVLEPERSDPWLGRFSAPGMTWCIAREVDANGSGPAAGSTEQPGEGDLEAFVHAWLNHSATPGTQWVARISGPYADVARSVDRLFRGDSRSTAAAIAVDATPASVTLAATVDLRDLHLLVRRAWRHRLTLALLRIGTATTDEVVAALDRGDDGQALAWADRVAVCQSDARRCSLGASDPSAPPASATAAPAITLPPYRLVPLERARVRWTRARGWILVGLLVGLLVACAAVAVVVTGALSRGSAPPPVGAATSPQVPATASPSAAQPTPTAAPTPTPPPTPAVPASVRLTASPSQRTGEAVAFDGERKAGVLFGGTDSGAKALGETWLFDGTAWKQVSPTTSPPPRGGAAMAFNPSTGHVVLVGGTSATGAALDDTWVWDGTTWGQVSARTRPTAGSPIGLVYDEAVGSLVLVTRATGSATALQTWMFANGAWTQPRGGAVTTVAGAGAALAYDPALSRLVLVSAGAQGPMVWDGSSWSTAAGPVPPLSSAPLIAYDAASRQLVLADPTQAGPGSAWTYDGSAWHTVMSSIGPARVAALMSTSTGMIAFGGPSAAADLSEAWRWSAVGWGG